MTSKKSITVNLRGNYPIFKKTKSGLIELESAESGKRYALTTNIQDGTTYYLQYSEEEEAEANRQFMEWQAGAEERANKEQQIALEAKKFEQSLKYEQKIVAFLDVLGWREIVKLSTSSQNDIIKMLGKTLAIFKSTENFYNSLKGMLPNNHGWPGNPVVTQFSDSIVISVSDDQHGQSALINALYLLTSNLIQYGFLIRGAIVRGGIYHNDGIIFGQGLIDAYELEKKSCFPRIILSEELANEWSGREQLDGSLPWRNGSDGYSFFNFIPPFMGSPFFKTDESSELWCVRLNEIRKLILYNAEDKILKDEVFAKYQWLAEYFDAVCDEYPQCGVAKVLQEALNLRRSNSSNLKH